MTFIHSNLTKVILWGCCVTSLLLMGCSDSAGFLDDDIGNGSAVLPEDAQKYKVSFNVTGQKASSLRASTPFPSGAQASIFTFVSGGAYVGYKDYMSASDGVLNSKDNEWMLPTGRYDFYAASTGTDELPPRFSYSEAKVKNGVDYLWSKVAAKAVENTDSQVSLEFDHIASRIILNFKAGQLYEIDYVRIQQPDVAEARWNLISGTISVANGLDPSSLLEMRTSTNQAMIEIIPIEYNDKLHVQMSVKRVGHTNHEQFTLDIPLVNNKAVPGTSYTYYIEFAEDAPNLYEVSIAPWGKTVDMGTVTVPITY